MHVYRFKCGRVVRHVMAERLSDAVAHLGMNAASVESVERIVEEVEVARGDSPPARDAEGGMDAARS